MTSPTGRLSNPRGSLHSIKTTRLSTRFERASGSQSIPHFSISIELHTPIHQSPPSLQLAIRLQDEDLRPRRPRHGRCGAAIVRHGPGDYADPRTCACCDDCDTDCCTSDADAANGGSCDTYTNHQDARDSDSGYTYTNKAPVTPTPTTKAPAPAPAPITKAPAATPAATPPKGHTFPADCTEVSVQGDATFCINGPVCFGSGASPSGSKCPVKGDYASDDCHDYLKSADSKNDYCIAPINATCAKIKSGAWGCVWNLPSSSTKTSLAIDGAATSAGSSVGAIAGIVAAAFAVAGAAVAAVVVQRKKRAEQQQVVKGEFCLANSPVRSA